MKKYESKQTYGFLSLSEYMKKEKKKKKETKEQNGEQKKLNYERINP